MAGAVRRVCAALAVCVTVCLAPQGSHARTVSVPAPAHPRALTTVVVATGFMPNVEFAPYYVAQDLGFYRAEGLNVVMNYDRVSNLMQAVSRGQYTFAIASGDAVAIGKSQGAAVTYVMAQYQRYPVGAMALKTEPPLRKPADLKGLTIGISTPGGATDIGLRALLRAGGLRESDVKVTAIGFTETEALINHQIDVAMTYIDNEPVQAAALGHPVNVLPVSRYLKLVSTGVVAGQTEVTDHSGIVQRFVTATLRGLRYTLNHPGRAFSISMKRQPEITDPAQIAIQRKVLTARLTFQRPPKHHPLGWSNPADWAATVRFLRSIGLISRSVTVRSVDTNIFTNTFAVRARA